VSGDQVYLAVDARGAALAGIDSDGTLLIASGYELPEVEALARATQGVVVALPIVADFRTP
jgi:hypothetical protein